jgi:hypothetical protein
MILCPKASPESLVHGNAIYGGSPVIVVNIEGRSLIFLDIEDIGRVGIMFDNLRIGLIANPPCAQVCLERAADDAFIAEKD